MTPQRFQQVRNLFEAALERDTGERAAFVAEACQNDPELREEVGRLLEARDATVTLAMPSASAEVRTDPASREGRRLGDYEILRELGRGGMGTVYLARRADQAFQKNVAIKILRSEAANSDIVRRFQREREILAQLDHPNIARLLDAGSTDDGLPYFVMEYVEGRSITGYADDQRLPTRERIDLFRQVCDAVEYAHQRNVVHRDLKPGNVLVTAAGQVKLLDFGIARLVERAEAEAGGTALTQSGMWLMTPEYASPEQVRGEVAGRASDVYSLGVILFELLTGHRPYHLRKRIFHEIVRVVCEEPPTRPSTVITEPVEATTADGKPTTLPPETAGRLRQTSLDDLKQQLSGNLDNIVLKALQKQPQDRYASPMQLRADIDRHLRGEEVWARSDSLWYRMGRIASRHTVSLVVCVALIAAVSSGAVNVRWSALWWVAGAASAIGLWHAATDRELGQRIAGSWMFSTRGGWGLLCIGAWVAAVAFVIVFQNSFTGSQLEIVKRTLPWIASAYSLFAAYRLAAWLWRRRWSGPLLMNLGNNTSARLHSTLGAILALQALGRLGKVIDQRKSFPNEEFFVMLVMVATGALVILLGRTEIRRDGILKGGALIAWSRIASWTWEGAQEQQIVSVMRPKKSLVLQLHRRIGFLGQLRIHLAMEHTEAVDAILARQLGEWPGRSRLA